jgi:uncharacterized protein YndB with AHSA1/START domain
MIRTVQIPLSQEEVFQALTDPIALMVWLDALSVTTGAEVFHVFEVVHNRGQFPWRIRGSVIECVSPETFIVETDPHRKQEKALLTLRLGEEESGCHLSVGWTGSVLAPVATGLLDLDGVARLARSLKSPAMKPI